MSPLNIFEWISEIGEVFCLRKVLVYLFILVLLAACSPRIEPVPPDEPEQPGPGVEEPEPGGNEGEPEPEPSLLPQGEVVWQQDSGRDIQFVRSTGDILLNYAESRISGQSFTTGSTLWVRDFAAEGFKLSDDLLYENEPLLLKGKLTYPITKAGQGYLEQLDVATGQVVWRFAIGALNDIGYFIEGELIKVLNLAAEKVTYYSLSEGLELPYLSGCQAYWHQGSYYGFGQAPPYTVAKYNPQAGQLLWRVTLEGDLDRPHFSEVIGRQDLPLFGITEYFRDQVQTYTVAINGKKGELLWTKIGYLVDTLDNRVLLRRPDSLVIVESATGKETEVVENDDAANSFFWGGSLYVAGSDFLRREDPATGDVIWEQKMPGQIELYHSHGAWPEESLAAMDVIWVFIQGISEGDAYYEQLAAIEPATGRTLAVYPFAAPDEIWPVRLTKDSQGKSYVILEKRGHQEYSFQLIDANTGNKLWQYTCPKGYPGNLLLDGTGNAVVLIQSDSGLEALYLAKHTGEKRGHFSLEGCPHLLIAGKVLLTTTSGKTVLVGPPK